MSNQTVVATEEVVWNTNNPGYGWRKTKYGGHRCSTLEIGIRDGILGYFKHICLLPTEIQQLIQEKKKIKKLP